MIFSVESFSLRFGTPNEDSFAIKRIPTGALFAAVADGVGGNVGGELASSLAVEAAELLLSNEQRSSFDSAFSSITESLRLKAAESPEFRDMATTLSVIVLEGDEARFAHVGDSRICHLRNEGIVQRTEDQTEAAELVRQGILSPKRALTYPRRSVLTSALSAKGEYRLNSGCFDIAPQDRILLMTDGVYRLISKREIRDLSIASNSLSDFSMRLSSELLDRGLKDDATMVLIEVMS